MDATAELEQWRKGVAEDVVNLVVTDLMQMFPHVEKAIGKVKEKAGRRFSRGTLCRCGKRT